MRDGHGRCIGVSRTGLASLHATTLLHWRSGCHDLFVLGLVARGAHPGRRSPSDRLGKWSGAHMRSAIPRRLRDGAVEQGLTRPCCCICSQAEASPPPGKGASSCSAGELRIIRSSSEALASGPKLVQRTIERSHLLRREPSSEDGGKNHLEGIVDGWHRARRTCRSARRVLHVTGVGSFGGRSRGVGRAATQAQRAGACCVRVSFFPK